MLAGTARKLWKISPLAITHSNFFINGTASRVALCAVISTPARVGGWRAAQLTAPLTSMRTDAPVKTVVTRAAMQVLPLSGLITIGIGNAR